MGVNIRPTSNSIVIEKPFLVAVCVTSIDKLIGLPVMTSIVCDPEHFNYQPKLANRDVIRGNLIDI